VPHTLINTFLHPPITPPPPPIPRGGGGGRPHTTHYLPRNQEIMLQETVIAREMYAMIHDQQELITISANSCYLQLGNSCNSFIFRLALFFAIQQMNVAYIFRAT
jgi:hypothetical protein